MNYQVIAKECIKQGLQFPEMDASNTSPKYRQLLDNARRARIDSFVKTKSVADGSNPGDITIKCYAPCHEMVGGTPVYSDFKDESSIKEYMLSGMCQACQKMIFG